MTDVSVNGARRKGTNITSPYKALYINTFPNTARMKTRIDLDLGKVVYQYHIPDFCLNLLNCYDFYF